MPQYQDTGKGQNVATTVAYTRNGELYVLLAHSLDGDLTIVDPSPWNFPVGQVEQDDFDSHEGYPYAAARVLKAETGANTADKSIDLTTRLAEIQDKGVVDIRNQQVRFYYHNQGELTADAEATLKARLEKSGSLVGGELKFVKLSELGDLTEANKQYDGRKFFSQLPETLVGIKTDVKAARDKAKKNKLKEDKVNPVIITTSGADHNCLGASFGEWFVMQSLAGADSTQRWLDGNAANFNVLRDTLNADGFGFIPLAPVVGEPAPTAAQNLKALAAQLAALPTTKERQDRLGKAMRIIVADMFLVPQTDANVSLQLEGFKARLVNSFENFLAITGERPNGPLKDEIPEEMLPFYTEVAAEFKRVKEDASIADKKAEIRTWWNNNKVAYGNKIKGSTDFLTEKHGALLAAKFGLRFQYHKSGMTQATDVENGIDEEDAPAVTVFSSPDHYSAHVPEQLLLDYYATVTDSDKQPIASSKLSEAHQAQIDKLRETAVVAFTSKLSDEALYTKVYSQFSTPYPEKTPESSATLTFSEYFDTGSFRLETKQATTAHGIVLQFTQEKSRAKGSEENAALVIAATDYKPTDAEHPLSEVELKQKKLESVALAYAASFAALLPDDKKDQLQINITEIGKTWDETSVVAAFRAAGFKRIQINGVDKWNEITEEIKERKAREVTKANPDDRLAAREVEKDKVVEKATTQALALAKEHPAATIGATLTSALTLVQLYNGGVSSAAKTLVVGGGLTAVAELVANEKTRLAVMQWAQDQLRRMPQGQQAKELAALGGIALFFVGATYLSGATAWLPDANSGFIKNIMMGVGINALAGAFNKFIAHQPHGTAITKANAQTMVSGLSSLFQAYKAWTSGSMIMMFSAAVPYQKRIWQLAAHEEKVVFRMVKPADNDELFVNKNVVISKNGPNYWVSYPVTTSEKDTGCRHILIKADSSNQAERELHAALEKANITEDREVANYTVENLAKQVARQAPRILLVDARPSDEAVLAHQGVLIHKVADGQYEVAFAQFNKPENQFKVQRGAVKITDPENSPTRAIAEQLQAVTEPFVGQEVNATITGLLKKVPAYPADIGRTKPAVSQALTTVKGKVGEKAKDAKDTALVLLQIADLQWRGMSETQKLVFSGSLAAFTFYVCCTSGDWTAPEISYITSLLSAAAMGVTKKLGFSWSESLLAFSAANLTQFVTFGAFAAGKWALGYGGQQQIEDKSSVKLDKPSVDTTQQDVGTGNPGGSEQHIPKQGWRDTGSVRIEELDEHDMPIDTSDDVSKVGTNPNTLFSSSGNHSANDTALAMPNSGGTLKTICFYLQSGVRQCFTPQNIFMMGVVGASYLSASLTGDPESSQCIMNEVGKMVCG